MGNIPFEIDSEGLAKMFDESGVVVLSSYLFIITNLGFGMYVPLCVFVKCFDAKFELANIRD